jgi:benzoyl-CoA reductase subunit C
MNYQKLFSSEIATDVIKKWRDSGKKALGIVCCQVPFELLNAADILPVRLRATSCKDCGEGEACLGPSSCSFTQSILQYLIDGTYDLDGLMTSNGCSSASVILGNWEKLSQQQNKSQFLYEVSAPRLNNAGSRDYLRGDLEDVCKELEKLSGNTITNEKLKKSIDTYNEARRLVKQVYALHKAEYPVLGGEETLRITLAATEMPIEDYIEFLEAVLADAKNRKPIENFGARVMLAGSALDDPEFVKAIEDCGCLVVADLNSFGIRFLRDELIYDEADIMGSIAKYYISRSSCPRMMDGSDDIHEYILNAAKEYAVDGIIIERLKHCEKWENEASVLGETFKSAGIPYLELERQERMSAEGQLSMRVEAFREMIENRTDK